MKTFLTASIIVGLLVAGTAFASITIKAVKWYNFDAQIEMPNAKGNLFIYEVERGDNTCFVMASDDTKYGFEPQISCVNNK